MCKPLGLLLFALVILPIPARAQESCLALSSFQWTSIDTTIPPDQWGGCTPDGLDQFEINNGHTVEIAGPIEFSGAGTSPRLTVSAGGTLIGHPPGRLTLGDKGMRVLEGGRLVARGRYHTFGVVPAVAEAERDADNFWEVGSVVPCPAANGSADCATSPAHVVRLVLPPTIEAPDDGHVIDGALAESLSAVAVGDSVCFFARDRARVWDTPAEDGFCYEIVGVGDSGPDFHLDIDVRQGEDDPTGMPLARRDIQESSTLAAILPGDRCVDVPEGLIGEDQLFASRWLRWGGESTAHRIAMTLADLDCSGVDTSQTTQSDSILIAERRGFPGPIDAGTPLRIGYGFRPGDSFFVMRPFVIERADGLAEGDAPVLLDARVDIQAVIFRQVRGVNIGAAGSPFESVQIDGWNDIWAIDSGAAVLFRLADEGHIVLGHTTATGGDERPEIGTHGFSVRGVTALTLRDVALRYTGDDCLAVNQAGGNISLIDVERFRCQFIEDGSQSVSALDDSGSNPRVLDLQLRDVECADCTESHGLRFLGPNDYSVDGYLAIGIDGGRLAIGPTAHFSNVLATGLTLTADQSLLPESIDHCSIRDVRSESTKTLGVGHLDSCILSDVSNTSSSLIQISSSATSIDNVALIRPYSNLSGCRDGTATCAVLRWQLPVEGGESPGVERVSIVFDGGQESHWKWMSRNHGVNAALNLGARLGGLLIANHAHPFIPADSLSSSLSDLDISGGGFCFDGNESDGDPAALLSLPPGATSTGVPLGFVDPAIDRWDVNLGSVADDLACGAGRGVDAPGNRGYRWIHAISGLVPELLADDPDEDGIPDDPAAAVCSGGSAAGCSDNCPDDFNPDQDDADGDSIGTACDLACDDGVDNDLDGEVDFPDDPGCRDATWGREDPRCDDDIDNDAMGDGTDWDGGSGGDVPDPQCVGQPWRNTESNRCGLGVEWVGFIWLCRVARRRLSSARRATH